MYRLAALLVLLLGLAGSAGAAPADATDEAFGVLLAMPGAQPTEGGWVIPQDAAQDEKDLIAQWQRLRKEGANFNAMRHRGTLLAHAIRAGQQRAAIWLLRNGADARKVLVDSPGTAYDLAREYQRAAVVKVLEGQYGFKPAKTAAATVAPPTREESPEALMQRLVGQVLQPSDEAQKEWRRYAATLSRDQFQALFKDGTHLDELVILTRHQDGGLEEALSRLPLALVRAHAQLIADRLADWSYVTYGDDPKRIVYTGASRSWPALWQRLDQPLRYDTRPDLAARIPPALWPGLFASGYGEHDAEMTGCVLAAVDLPGLKALWPDFQRHFTNAREAAPGLVLAAYRIAREQSPCYYGSTPAETAAKLAFLRAQGVTSPVHGLRQLDPSEPLAPALAEMVAAFSPKAAVQPRLVRVPPSCELALGEPWLDLLIQARTVGWGVPARSVAVVDVPGLSHCGLLIGGDSFAEWPQVSDSFSGGPSREPGLPRCADAPDDGEIWVPARDGLRRVDVGMETRGTGFSSLRQVRDVQTGKRYWLNAGQTGAMCSQSNQLPDALEWQADAKGPQLVPSRDGLLLDRLLRRQCQRPADGNDVTCPDLDAPEAPAQDGVPALQRLRYGGTVSLHDLLDAIGTERRTAYRAALAAHDHAQLRRLLASGIPPWWTAGEIQALATADLPVPEKRRRIALLFADAGQLSQALNVEGNDLLAKSLGAWLPRQDWGPILRLIGQAPDAWYDMARALRASAAGDVACDIDRAQGFLCEGGIKVD